MRVITSKLYAKKSIFHPSFGFADFSHKKLIQPITQNTSIDPLVQGLSAFLLGVCYEFNREPGEITRATLHPILHSRIGPDQFVSRMARLREDPRFRAVQPDEFELTSLLSSQAPMGEEEEEDMEVWFDWAFVDFWKNHYCKSACFADEKHKAENRRKLTEIQTLSRDQLPLTLMPLAMFPPPTTLKQPLS